MKDLPMFTTEYGIASLTLSQIPLTGKAYICLQSILDERQLVDECVRFCKMCGANEVYASGVTEGEYPFHTTILEMKGIGNPMQENSVCVWPLLAENSEKWRDIYNTAMQPVDNAVLLSTFDMKEHIANGDCYFVHEGGEVIGIGKASNGHLDVIVSVQKGCGSKVLRAMLSLPNMEEVTLVVASTNEKARHLYEKNGFLVTKPIRDWFKIL